MEEFNASLSYDKRMWKEDIQVVTRNFTIYRCNHCAMASKLMASSFGFESCMVK